MLRYSHYFDGFLRLILVFLSYIQQVYRVCFSMEKCFLLFIGWIKRPSVYVAVKFVDFICRFICVFGNMFTLLALSIRQRHCWIFCFLFRWLNNINICQIRYHYRSLNEWDSLSMTRVSVSVRFLSGRYSWLRLWHIDTGLGPIRVL